VKHGIFNIELPPIWVANLQRSHERRRFMQRQLQAMGLDCHFINAIDGENLTENDLQKYSQAQALKAKGRELSTGEIGCALTHASMYRQMIDNNIEEVLILEDDVCLTQDLLQVLRLRRDFPDDWDVINFTNNSAETIPLGKPIFAGYRICKFEGMANRASAYLINLNGAKKVIDHLYPIRLPADDMIGRSEIAGLHLYGITPRVVALANFKSDIWDYDDQLYDFRPLIEFDALKVGQRVKVKGKLGKDGPLAAHEIIVDTVEASAERADLEGLIQRLDLQKNTLRLLNREIALPEGIAVKDLQGKIIGLQELKAGDLVKLSGKYSPRKGFAPKKIKMKEAASFGLEEVQGDIDKVDREKKTLEVAGFMVMANEKTRIV
jgi:glycosyl transferase family 25